MLPLTELRSKVMLLYLVVDATYCGCYLNFANYPEDNWAYEALGHATACLVSCLAATARLMRTSQQSRALKVEHTDFYDCCKMRALLRLLTKVVN